MQLTQRLLQHASRLIFFTRQNCSLCTDAKGVLQNIAQSRQFDYQEVDVMKEGQEKWKAAYEFDVPGMYLSGETATIDSEPQFRCYN